MEGDEPLQDRLERGVRALLDAAGERTGLYARLGRLRIDLVGIQRERGRALRSLGERAAELIRRGEGSRIESDEIVVQVLREIGRLDAERLERLREIDELRASAGASGVRRPRGSMEERW